MSSASLMNPRSSSWSTSRFLHSFNLKSLQEPVDASVNAIVIGGGPAGLASAIMLAQRGYQVKVFDKAKQPLPADSPEWSNFVNERNYNIGLSGRGQKALKVLNVMDRIEKYTSSVNGRIDWTPERPDVANEVNYEGKSYTTKCIQRDRLVAALLEEIHENYPEKISYSYDTDCRNVEWLRDENQREICLLTLTKSSDPIIPYNVTWIEKSAFVIGADGAQSLIRSIIHEDNKLKVFKFEDKNVRVYRTIPMYLPDKPTDKKVGRKDVNYSVRTKSDINFDALPTKEGIYLGVVLFRPWDNRFKEMKTLEKGKEFFQKLFPMFAPFIRDSDIEDFISKSDSKFAKFSYVGPNLHKGQTTVLLGDSIHTVKPFFGLGVNSAFEDILVLKQSLDKTNDSIPKALQVYSKERAKEAKTMVEISKKLDGGFFQFVFPLIVDSIFHRIAPIVFKPNIISLIQNENLSYTQVRTRKRLDRVMQLAFVGFSLVAFKFVMSSVFNIVKKLLLRLL